MLKTNVKPTGIKVLLWAIVILALMNISSRLNIIDLQSWQMDVITLFSILFVATEIGIMTAIQGKKRLDPISIFGTLVVIVAFVALVFSWFGVALTFLDPFKGFVELALVVFVILEIFR